MAKRKRILVKVDTSWFDEKADEYFARDDFREFERLLLGNRTDLSLRDFHTTCMEDVAHRDKKAALQELWADKSIVATSVQDYHFGFGFPFLAYTHCFDLFEPPPRWDPKIDLRILGMDLSDSLRRRHIVLSQAVIPTVVHDLHRSLGHPIILKNLGAGTGLDTLRTALKFIGGGG